MPTFTKTKNTDGMLYLRRLLFYVFGLFLMSLGVGFSVKSDLGISPVNSVPYALSRVTGLDQGLMTTLVFCLFVLLQILLLRRDFRPLQLLQVGCATVFGYFVNFSNRLLSGWIPESYVSRLLFMAVSVILISVGMFLYLSAKLIPQPLEGLCLAIESRFGFRYANIKVTADCALVAAAAAITLLCTGKISGLREGTVFAMFSIGKLIGFCMDRWGKRMHRICFGRNAGAA